MAVVIASSLRKELSGGVLFDGVSFKVERRDRLALAGPNGAGKTTLLRALAGEVSLEGGELALEQGHADRAARPAAAGPEQTAAARLRPRGHRRPRGRRGGAARARAGDGVAATHDPATLRRYSAAQARLEHAGGYDWRDRAASVVRGLGFTDDDLDRPLSTFSGGELTRASLARALASQPDLLLLDEPTNHLDIESLEWLEKHAEDARRGRHPRRARPLVPRSGDDGGARARGRQVGLLPRRLARLAARAGGARDPPDEDRRAPGRADRAPRALRRALPLQGVARRGRRSRSSSRSRSCEADARARAGRASAGRSASSS